MDQEIKSRLDAQEAMLAKIYASAEKTRKYILWTGIVTLALIVLPAIGLVFVIPSYVSQLNSQINLVQ